MSPQEAKQAGWESGMHHNILLEGHRAVRGFNGLLAAIMSLGGLVM